MISVVVATMGMETRDWSDLTSLKMTSDSFPTSLLPPTVLTDISLGVPRRPMALAVAFVINETFAPESNKTLTFSMKEVVGFIT